MHRSAVTVGSHLVRVHRNGRELFPAMLAALDGARRRVCVETYWWEADLVGRPLLEAVTRAAARGVEVRVLVDGFGSYALPRSFWKPLEDAGGKVGVFHPFPGIFAAQMVRTLFARDHRKVLVADATSFVGGLNFTRAWAAIGDGGEDWRDTALELQGEATAKHLTALFDETWAMVVGGAALEPEPNIAWMDQQLAIYSNTPASRRGRRIRQAYLAALRSSRKTVDITCAYFAPRPLFLRALTAAVRRGVRVRLLVPLRSDVELARQVAVPLLRWLDRRGVELFAYGGAILHAKTAVVDGLWCTVGSHNLDGLSWAWNLECNVVLRHAEVAAQLTALFEEDICLSVRLRPGEAGLVEWLLPESLRRWYSHG